MQKIGENKFQSNRIMSSSIQMSIDYRKKVLKQRRNEILRQRRCEILDIDEFWDIDYWIEKVFDKEALTSFKSSNDSISASTRGSTDKKTSFGFRKSPDMIVREKNEHVEEYARRLLKLDNKQPKFELQAKFSGFKGQKNASSENVTFEDTFELSNPIFEVLSRLYFYTKYEKYNFIDALLYLKNLSKQDLKILKVLLKGKFTSIVVLNYFHLYVNNAQVRDFIYRELFNELKWVCRNRNFFLKSKIVEIFARMFETCKQTSITIKNINLMKSFKLDSFRN